MKIKVLAAMILLLLASCQEQLPPQTQTVRVERVVSGQTLEVSDPETGERDRVRLLGIQAPNAQQFPWGDAAKQRLQTLVGGEMVRLETDMEPRDRFDRQLAYVWHDKQLINEVIVRDGYVLARSYFPNAKYEQRLDFAQQEARLLDRQIWNPDNPLRQSLRSNSEFRIQSSS